MKITFLGKDSTPNDSPTLYATDRETYLVQGYELTTDATLVAGCTAAFEKAWPIAVPHGEYVPS